MLPERQFFMSGERLIPLSEVEKAIRKSHEDLIENLSISEKIIEEENAISNPFFALERIEKLLDIELNDEMTCEQRLNSIAEKLQEIPKEIEKRLRHGNSFYTSSIPEEIDAIFEERAEPLDVINITLRALHNKTWNDLDSTQQLQIKYLLKDSGLPLW